VLSVRSLLAARAARLGGIPLRVVAPLTLPHRRHRGARCLVASRSRNHVSRSSAERSIPALRNSLEGPDDPRPPFGGCGMS